MVLALPATNKHSRRPRRAVSGVKVSSDFVRASTLHLFHFCLPPCLLKKFLYGAEFGSLLIGPDFVGGRCVLGQESLSTLHQK